MTRAAPAVLAAACASAALAEDGAPPDYAAAARIALERACAVAHPAEAAGIGPGLPGYRGQNGPARAVDMFGWRVEFALDGAALMLSRLARPGARGRVTVEARADGDGRVLLAVIADSRCRVRGARRLRRGPGGAAEAIDLLDSRLEPTGESLPVDPPPPPAPADGGDGPAVGLVDTGVNYLLPEIAARLARGADGAPLGYDYWDLDPRPFDSDPVRSPLFPARHGTRTASLLLRESPVARLAPYRYPRPDMDRMADLVADAARIGARVVNLSLASSDRARWRAYEAAARRNPHILFVAAAGNRRRDLDRDPMYPAALGLANQLVVTAATADGRLSRDANWGRRSVDVMVAAEGLRAVGFDGAERAVSGSSFAAARMTALAACLLAEDPALAAPALKALLLARAGPGPESRRVAHGFVPDPTTAPRGACPALPRRRRPGTVSSRCAVGVPYGTRTRVSGVRGRRPGPLDEGDAAVILHGRGGGGKRQSGARHGGARRSTATR